MKVLLSRQGGLFICGTNAFNPLCANYTVSTECLKHACISHAQKTYFGKSPHPLVFNFPNDLAMVLGSVFSHYIFSFFIYSLQPITFLTHILFHSPQLFFFFTSRYISEQCLQRRSKWLWLHWVTMHFWPGWESVQNPQAERISPAVCLYSVFPPAWPSICPEAPSCFWWPQEQRAVINQSRCSFPCVVVYSKRIVMPLNWNFVRFQDSECVCLFVCVWVCVCLCCLPSIWPVTLSPPAYVSHINAGS